MTPKTTPRIVVRRRMFSETHAGTLIVLPVSVVQILANVAPGEAPLLVEPFKEDWKECKGQGVRC